MLLSSINSNRLNIFKNLGGIQSNVFCITYKTGNSDSDKRFARGIFGRLAFLSGVLGLAPWGDLLLPSWGVGKSLTCLFIVARALVLFLLLGWDVVELR